MYARDDNKLNFSGVAPCIADHGDIEFIYELQCSRAAAEPRIRWRHAEGIGWHEWKVGDSIEIDA